MCCTCLSHRILDYLSKAPVLEHVRTCQNSSTTCRNFPVMDKNGNPLTTNNEQLKRWAEHFRVLLNRPTPDSPPDIPPAETELPISCDKPSKTEIKKAIMTLRNGKAAGPDEIPAEAIKADIETAVQMLYSFFSKI